MDELGTNIYAFFAVVEAVLVLLVLALALFLRSRSLSGRVQALQRRLKKDRERPEQVTFDQYLRDEIIRNEDFVEQAVASASDEGSAVASLLRTRKQFLELELTMRSQDKNPVRFKEGLAAGLSELLAQLRPAAEESAAVAESEPPATVRDTHDEEFSRLKQVINNQQDAMAVLRDKLRARDGDSREIDEILATLDVYERNDSELQQCLKVLEKENQRLKMTAAASTGRSGDGDMTPARPVEPGGLQRLVGDQQKTVAELQELIRELSPEAGKAADLEAAVASIQRANQELTGCVAVLEDENAMLRSELESVNAQLDRQDAMREEASLEITQELKTADEERRQLEIKVQELGALVEFKDAAIEELEKQYRTLESRYAALSERK
jgi:hypothetical protein